MLCFWNLSSDDKDALSVVLKSYHSAYQISDHHRLFWEVFVILNSLITAISDNILYFVCVTQIVCYNKYLIIRNTCTHNQNFIMNKKMFHARICKRLYTISRIRCTMNIILNQMHTAFAPVTLIVYCKHKDSRLPERKALGGRVISSGCATTTLGRNSMQQ